MGLLMSYFHKYEQPDKDNTRNTEINKEKYPNRNTSFIVLSDDMVPLNNEPLVKKRIINEGTEVIPDVGTVYMECIIYVKDSTKPVMAYLGDKLYTFILGCDIEGFNVAVKSMKKKEKAQFLIDQSLAFGDNGIVNFVPPKSDLYVTITLIDFIESELIIMNDYEIDASISKLSFEKLNREINVIREEGNKHYKEKKYEQAIGLYKKCLYIINKTPVPDENKKLEIDKLKCTVLTNLSNAFNKINKYDHASKHAKEALEIDPYFDKAKFQLGIALINVRDMDNSYSLFKELIKKYPSNNVIKNYMNDVEEKIEIKNEEIKLFYHRCFNLSK